MGILKTPAHRGMGLSLGLRGCKDGSRRNAEILVKTTFCSSQLNGKYSRQWVYQLVWLNQPTPHTVHTLHVINIHNHNLLMQLEQLLTKNLKSKTFRVPTWHFEEISDSGISFVLEHHISDFWPRDAQTVTRISLLQILETQKSEALVALWENLHPTAKANAVSGKHSPRAASTPSAFICLLHQPHPREAEHSGSYWQYNKQRTGTII